MALRTLRAIPWWTCMTPRARKTPPSGCFGYVSGVGLSAERVSDFNESAAPFHRIIVLTSPASGMVKSGRRVDKEYPVQFGLPAKHLAIGARCHYIFHADRNRFRRYFHRLRRPPRRRELWNLSSSAPTPRHPPLSSSKASAASRRAALNQKKPMSCMAQRLPPTRSSNARARRSLSSPPRASKTSSPSAARTARNSTT